MAEQDTQQDDKGESPGFDMDNQEEASRHSGANSNAKAPYRQKYKHDWELDNELREWLTACSTDTYAAYCRYCRTKLHAHKKGLLAHAKSAKHKKHVENPSYGGDSMSLVPTDSTFNMSNGSRRDSTIDNGFLDDSRGSKRNLKGQRLFNDNWLKDPAFSEWLRRVPNNRTKAFCIACRCVLAAGRCELIKHTRAAKHKKAITEGPFEEMGDDLQWLDTNEANNQSLQVASYSQQTVSASLNLPGLLVDEILDRLNDHIPLNLAESWDNVGVITKPTQQVRVYNVMLTIDLHEKVVEEALKRRVQFIISYHPPIFNPIKSLDPNKWKDRAILLCIEHKITVYSPHTALDAGKGGINDWLVSSFMSADGNTCKPIHYSTNKANTSCLEVLLSGTQDVIGATFKDMNNCTMTEYANGSTDVRVTCNDNILAEVLEKMASDNCTQLTQSRVTQLAPEPIPGVGMGRLVHLGTPLPLYEVVQRTKAHLDLSYLRLALSPKHSRDMKVNTIAVCAGSGTSVLKGCKADVWITGEMSHHDILEATFTGITIILCEHSNTERGFLRDWSNTLRTSVFEDKVVVSVSGIDKDPLKIV